MIYQNDLFAIQVLKEKETKKDAVIQEVVGDNADVEENEDDKRIPLNEA